MVDTLGLVLRVVITAASVQDRDGAKLLCDAVRGEFSRLRTIFADGGYAGQLVGWVKQACGWVLEIVKRTSPGWEVLPKRWVVERTFAWLTRYRALARDYEVLPETLEAQTYAVMVHLMARRFAKHQRRIQKELEPALETP